MWLVLPAHDRPEHTRENHKTIDARRMRQDLHKVFATDKGRNVGEMIYGIEP